MTPSYRAKNRAQHPISSRALVMDLAITNFALLLAILFLLGHIKNTHLREWTVFPLGILYSNFMEYLTHRFVMHRKRKFLGVFFERHAIQHHSFFTNLHSSYDRFSDCRLVFFPAPMQFLFVVVGVSLGYFCARPVFGENVSYVFTLSLLVYFMNYVLFHYIYHTQESSWLLKLPGLRYLRALHSLHHDKTQMRRVNFNIAYPIFDLVFGTFRSPFKTTLSKKAETL